MNVIIVLNYNDFDNTFHYVNRIRNYAKLDYILIVDNCSTDESFERLQNLKDDKVNVIRTDRNEGYASGNNFGVRYLEKNNIIPEYLIISNPDIEISEQDLEHLFAEFDKLPSDTFEISGLIYDRDMKVTWNYAWRKLTYGLLLRESTFIIDKILSYLKIRGREYDKQYAKENKIIEVDVVPGCFFIAKYELWKKVDGFTEGSFLYFEEDILAHKAHKAGFHNYIISDAKVIHMQGETINKNIASKWRKLIIYLNGCLFYIQNTLKAGKIRIFILKLVYYLSMFEKIIYYRLYHLFRKK
ncbi:MAG: glycosyltransferase family 2 protein [Lachnospiraceae bacterium]|nr:glycosyltransferase family 2 protein [Lachnospiraceae bacterium]